MDLLNKILLGSGAAIAAIIVIVILWLSFMNAHLRTELAQAQANATACHITNDNFAAAATRQNAAVTALKTENDAQLRQTNIKALLAQKQSQAALQAAQKLREQTARGDDCKAANDLFNQFIAGQK